MSELRNQLELAREKHRAARYPGDLAADVLGAARDGGRRKWWIGGLVGGAVAAGIALMVMTNGPEVGRIEEAREVVAAADVAELPEAPEMPGLPEEVPPMPSFPSLSGIGAEPEMPSFFDVM